MVIVDTNIVIEHLRQPKGKKTFLREILEKYPEGEVGISILTVQELYRGKSMDFALSKDYADKTVGVPHIFPYTYEVACLGGAIARHKKFVIDFVDAAVAATAILNRSMLITYNTKDFLGIKDLELL